MSDLVNTNILADGQLPASSGALLTAAGGSLGTVSVICYNANNVAETVTLAITRPNGTKRTIAAMALDAGDTLILDGVPLPDGAVLSGNATDASEVNYLITRSSDTKMSLQVLNSVGALKTTNLTSTLKTGIIQLDLGASHLIATNNIDTKANAAGIPAQNTGPSYQRINAATDKGLVLSWAATVVTEVQLPTVAIPPDCDVTQSVTLKMQAKMSSTDDTPVITVAAFEGIGDSTRGGNTAALSSVLQTLALAMTLTTAPNFLNLTLTPGAHGTDALNLYAAWLEYQRK